MSALQASLARNWRVLYKTALLELNSTKLPGRIAQAEKAIAEEAVLLMRSGGSGNERQALEDAMQTLEDLRRLQGSADVG
jgi:hypothetical protein